MASLSLLLFRQNAAVFDREMHLSFELVALPANK